MKGKQLESVLHGLYGVEVSISSIFFLMLWMNDYKIAFWIFLVMFISGMNLKVNRIKEAIK